MSDIKMSDVFHNGHISADLDEGSIIENGYPIFTEGCKYKAQAIATAVVSHDALVEQNKVLRDALEKIIKLDESIHCFEDGETQICNVAAAALEQAK